MNDSIHYTNLNKPGVKKWQIFTVEKEEEGQPLSMVFKTSNQTEAIKTNFPIKKTTTNRHEKLQAPVLQLNAPGRKDIKQVELYTKYRRFVPLVWQNDCCPKPADEILARFKIEKTENGRVHKEMKKNEEAKRIVNMANRAASFAMAQLPTLHTRALTNALVLDNNNDNSYKKQTNVIYSAL